ncbi:MAG: hypothetical protein J6Y01_09465, partial [Spirochaetales bacterium]|nr:hypothetical protein [Spirochaetales bacterium]
FLLQTMNDFHSIDIDRTCVDMMHITVDDDRNEFLWLKSKQPLKKIQFRLMGSLSPLMKLINVRMLIILLMRFAILIFIFIIFAFVFAAVMFVVVFSVIKLLLRMVTSFR